ncbi:MAG: 50S ribosomal protein L29 [Patescibacteria group bacterium]|nr:50S ribosomal protein L29 [Patescibacteria group bacterium]
MDFEEIKTKSPVELKELLADKQEELRGLRFKLQSQQLKQMHKVADIKKTIARIETFLAAQAKVATKTQ